MKKMICLMIVSSILSFGIVSAKIYDDVTDDAWYAEAVTFVSENDLMADSGNSFLPNENTTRAEYIYALYQMLSENDIYISSFDDVDENSTFSSAIGWAEQTEIASGVGDNLFKPDDSLTREAAMTFLYRALLSFDIADITNENSILSFADGNDVSEWAKESVNTLIYMGIINGTSENKIEPQKQLTNAEVAAIIYKVSKIKSISVSEMQNAKFETESYISNIGNIINYWLFTPENATKNMPLIVYLHGSHSQGDDINLMLNEDFCQMVANGNFDNTPAYIIFPQLSSSYRSWRNIHSELMGLINIVAEKYAINKSNISLMGFSLGGTGTINLATSYPGYFSRIAPIAGGAINMTANADALLDTPVRAFVGSDDVIVKPDTAQTLIDNLKAAGCDAQITVFEGAEHTEVPKLVFENKDIDIVSWLIGN